MLIVVIVYLQTLETSPKSSPTRCDFSVAPLSLAHSQDVGPRRHSVTVVSEVEASYEVLPAEALTLGRQTSPQSTVPQHTARKATTLAYSKSFHVARRTSSESSAPLTVSVSPRLTRHQPLVIKSIPPQVPPKTFSTDNDEFKKVFSKFRKHTDADSFDTVISSTNIDEPRSKCLFRHLFYSFITNLLIILLGFLQVWFLIRLFLLDHSVFQYRAFH